MDSTRRLQQTFVRHGTASNRHQTRDVQDRLVAFVDQATSSHADVRGVPRTLVRHFRQESCRTVDDTVARRERTRVFHLHASQGHCARDCHVAGVRQLREFTAFDFRHCEVTVDRQDTFVLNIRVGQRHVLREHCTVVDVVDGTTKSNHLACEPIARVRHRTLALDVTDIRFDVAETNAHERAQRTGVIDVTCNVQQLTVDRHRAAVFNGTAQDRRVVRIPLCTLVVGHDASQLDITDVEFEAFNLDSTSRVHLTVVRHGTVNNRHQTGDVQDRLVAFVDHATSSHADVRGVPRTLVRHFRQESCRTVDNAVTRGQIARVFHLHAGQGHSTRDRHRAGVRQLREFTAFDFRHGEVTVDRQRTLVKEVRIE